jgi:NAD+ diphosphatase
MHHDTHQRKLVCDQCGAEVFPRINPAVIVGVIDGERLLMTRYANGPVQRFVLIAGFTEIGETVEETVAREVLEEVGLRVKDIRYYGSQPWGVAGNLTLGFFCRLDGSDDLTVEEDELSEAQWFTRKEIPVPEDQTSLTSEMVRKFAEGKIR